ncbi:MAG TPA: radical SAM protein [Aquifex aeolicus]|nr:radical SAM protein [Aquifex aeolicus]
MRLVERIDSGLNRLLLFELEDGYTVEGVHFRDDTLCVSTQVGCSVRCRFCASGKPGLLRNLSAEEIIRQYLIAREVFPIRRIAVAGIGEPLHNWENVKKAFSFFRKEGLRVSFYTTGYPIRALDELLSIPHNGVSISIHALRPDRRRKIMPFAGSVERLLEYLRNRLPLLSRRKRKKVSLAYLLLGGINDSPRDLFELGNVAKELGVSITLLYPNEVKEEWAIGEERYERAFRFLRGMGVKVTLSTRFRRDKIGGCGTLSVGVQV